MGDTRMADVDMRALQLEQERVKLAERQEDRADRQLDWDNRFAKRWAPLIIPGLLTLFGGYITSEIASVNTTAQLEETTRTRLSLEHQKSVENARAAAIMYFDKLGDLRNKDQLTLAERKRYVNELNIVAILSDNQELHDELVGEAATVSADALAQTVDKGVQTSTPDKAVSGLPNLVTDQPKGDYDPATFLAFPQVPESRDEAAVDRFTAALGALRFRVQPVQHMALDKTPDHNEVRYYRADQKPMADHAAAALSTALGTPFVARQLGGANLPNGVIEVWLGKKPG